MTFLINSALAFLFSRRALLRLGVLSVLIASLFWAVFAQLNGYLKIILPSLREARAEAYQDTIRLLTLGAPVRQQVSGGEVHDFRVALKQGQYLRVIVEQQGINVAVKILGPDGLSLIEKDSPNGLQRRESVSIIAAATGDYIIQVRCDKAPRPGAYEIKVQELQEPTPENIVRVKAELAFAAGQKLRREGTAESRTKALDRYKETLSLWREVKDVHEEAYTLCILGWTYKALGDLAETTNYLGQAAVLLRNEGDSAGQAYALNETGAAHRDLGNPLMALDFYQQALVLRRAAADRGGEAQLLNNVGLIYANTGQQQKALENYRQALPLWQAVSDRSNEANTLNNIAGAVNELGESAQALEIFRQALKVFQEVGNKNLEAFARNNIALIYDTWADSQAALEEYEQSLALFRNLKNQQGEALVLDNIGMVHVGLGDTPKGLEFLNKALVIREQLKEPRGKAKTLNALGYAYGMQGSHREALNYYELALDFIRKSKDRKLEAYSLVNAGMSYNAVGEPQKALEYFKQALEIMKEIGDLRGQAIVLDKIGQAFNLIGNSTKALDGYHAALVKWAAVGDKQGQASSLYGIAVVESNRNNLSAARDKIEQANSIIESLRTKMTSQQLRLNYFSAKHDYYGLYIDVMMRLYEQNRVEADVMAALLASERARARSLLDLLNEAQAEVRQGVEPELVAQEHRLEREINAHSATLIRLRNQKHVVDAVVVEERLTALTEELERLQTKIRATSKSYAALKQPQPLTVKEIQQQLPDDNTLLLEFSLGEKRSYLWAVSRTAIRSYTLPKRVEIERAALELREVLTAYEPPKPEEDKIQYLERLRKSETEYQRRAAELSRMIFGRAAAQFGTKKLVIVPDGALQFIPFEALPQPKTSSSSATSKARSGRRAKPAVAQQLLIQNNEITYLPSATTLALIRNYPRAQTNKTVAVFADPVFNATDERIPFSSRKTPPQATEQIQSSKLIRSLRDFETAGENGFNLERLPNTLAEAKEAIAMVPAGSGMLAVSFQANRAAAMSQELAKYRIVHFATHGLLNDKHPELSGIVLSMVNESGEPQDGFLQLHDIYNLRLPVELVVLSACRTGIGKEVRGEGMIGLTRGFMYAGAARVVASLWKVDDRATAALMERFYWHLIKKQLRPSAALKAAKLDIMRAHKEWSEPYYWAGFVLQGDWK